MLLRRAAAMLFSAAFGSIGANEAKSQVAICNHTPVSAAISIVYYDGTKSKYVTMGWYNADPGRCVTPLATIPDGKIYYHAEAKNSSIKVFRDSDEAHWGASLSRCVSSGVFSYDDDYKCDGAGDKVARFAEINKPAGPRVEQGFIFSDYDLTLPQAASAASRLKSAIQANTQTVSLRGSVYFAQKFHCEELNVSGANVLQPIIDDRPIEIECDSITFAAGALLSVGTNLTLRANLITGSVKIRGIRGASGSAGASVLGRALDGDDGGDGGDGGDGEGANACFHSLDIFHGVNIEGDASTPGGAGGDGGPGGDADDGLRGADGAAGQDNVDIRILALKFDRAASVEITSNGGSGGAGGDGQAGGIGGDGGSGGNGGAGGSAAICHPASRGGEGGAGGNGGDGGDGGQGGSGGRGGNGGTIQVLVNSDQGGVRPSRVELENTGGKGGRPGSGGAGGGGGRAGRGGSGGVGGNGSLDHGGGADGYGGYPGQDGQAGSPGDHGSWGNAGADGVRKENVFGFGALQKISPVSWEARTN